MSDEKVTYRVETTTGARTLVVPEGTRVICHRSPDGKSFMVEMQQSARDFHGDEAVIARIAGVVWLCRDDVKVVGKEAPKPIATHGWSKS